MNINPLYTPINQNGVVFCSFEVSKEAKEVGFSNGCIGYYDTWNGKLRKAHQEDTKLAFTGFTHHSEGPNGVIDYLRTDDTDIYSDKRKTAAPTQNQLIDWLAQYNVFPVVKPSLQGDQVRYLSGVVTETDTEGLLAFSSFDRNYALECAIATALNMVSMRRIIGLI